MVDSSVTPGARRRAKRAPRARGAASALDLTLLGDLDEGLPVPLYVQLAEKFAAYIRQAGDLAVGTCLPSENQCLEFFRVSRPTVRQAMAELSAQGLIRRERGRGTFVQNARIEHDITHVFEEDMRAKGRTVTFRVLENIQMPAPSRLVGVFDAADRAGLRRIRRVRSLSGRPISLEDRYIPARYAEMLDEKLLTGSSIFLLLRRWAQAGTIRCVNAVRSELAGEEIIELLGVPPGTPVLVRETSYYGAHSTPLMYSSVSFLGPSYQFCFETEMKIA
ncbi:MAG: GntR family transcriptional regulator [Pollutimonas bauzanensis]|uniref:Transcriptional regulator, GntR family n=1 Tax=Pollutimonas bauzanensis TaxID=658167 RepID=A0A1M5VCK8_9BURK|nr:GntR family transcriptional regulator [Pollutimonas bauzanensis]SHH72653.1 transcriptional regulator, GntR family [Pollutimonas bauzanensis]